MITIATCLWAPNRHSLDTSLCYTPEWANRLAAGFRRNLTLPHRFVVFADKHYEFDTGVHQVLLEAAEPGYGSMIEPFRLDTPSIIVGLDTVVVGSIDHLAQHCLIADKLALPRSPGKDYACNGVALVPAGHRRIYDDWCGENDMDWVRRQPHQFIDDLFPGQVQSYRLQVRPNGLGDTRICYFHGRDKPHELPDEPLIREHWRT